MAAGAPRTPFPQGQRTRFCGVWDSGINYERVRGITMDALAESMRQRFAPALPHDVVDRTGLEGPFDVSLEFFRPAAAVMAVTPSLRLPLQAAGFVSVPQALEEQLGLTLVPSTARIARRTRLKSAPPSRRGSRICTRATPARAAAAIRSIVASTDRVT